MYGIPLRPEFEFQTQQMRNLSSSQYVCEADIYALNSGLSAKTSKEEDDYFI